MQQTSNNNNNNNSNNNNNNNNNNDAFLSSRSLQDRIQQERDRVKSKRDRLRSNRKLSIEADNKKKVVLIVAPPQPPQPTSSNNHNHNSIMADDSLAFMSVTSGSSQLVENEHGWIDATRLTSMSIHADSGSNDGRLPATTTTTPTTTTTTKHQKVIPLTTRRRKKNSSSSSISRDDNEEQLACWNRYKWLLVSLFLLCLAGGITAAAVVVVSRNKGDHGDDATKDNPNGSDGGTTSCQSVTNILPACACRSELPNALPAEVNYNRNLILQFLTLQGALPPDYVNTTSSTSCHVENQALVWVSDLNNHLVMPPSNLQLLQRYALAVVYQTLQGDTWTLTTTTIDDLDDEDSSSSSSSSSSKWLDPTAAECDWIGVVCSDASQRIVELHLSNNHLQGPLPTTALALLDSLRELHLNDNPDLVGQLQQQQQHEDDSSSSSTTLPLLQTLQLSRTSIGGTIPTEWAGSRLSELLLSDMQLTGTVPTELALLGRLRILDLSHNALTGTIPTDLSTQLTNLQALDVSSNQLRGALPTTWNSFFLEALLVHDNINLTGAFPEPYGLLLSFIHFGDTSLEGTIPSTYCTNLIYLDSLVVDCDNVVDIALCSCCQCMEDDDDDGES
mmetsp:Transcript_22452/g.37146  ORF Transcript_22452/g.37146 Transcript_22452/m.37146 type:complete len:618 (-) Transcript_22452:105-1958(-)